MTRLISTAAVVLALLSPSCAVDGGEGGTGSSPAAPAGEEQLCLADDSPTDWEYPEGPYGVEEGSVFANLELQDCDGNLVRFDEILASRELVFLSVGAGWCQPCIEEAGKLELGFHRQYCHRGLGVVQILFQDDSGGPATKHFCKEWKEEYGLTFPVLVDPLFVTGAFFDGSTAPLNLLINNEGVIEWLNVGFEPDELVGRIEAALPEAE